MTRKRGFHERARRLLLATAPARPPPLLLEEARAAAEQDVWEIAAAAAMRTNQEPLFHHFIVRHIPLAPLRRETRRTIDTRLRLHAWRWEEVRECLEGVTEALEEKGIQPVLLKGIGLVGDCYHMPRLRPMRDLDILVRAQEASAAQAALREWGFLENSKDGAARYAGHHHLPPLFHPSTRVCVELHHSPLGRRASLPGVPTSTDFWHGVRESKIAGANLRGGRAWALEPTLALLVACLHFGHSDHISWRVTHLIDATRLAELHADEIDWERLLLHATWPDLGRALALPLFYLAREGLPTAPAEALDRLVRRAGLRSWENRFLAALIDRYRFGIPGPWRVLSRRAANIVWGRALRSGSTLGRGWSALRLALRRRKRKPPSRAAGRRPLPEGQALGAP